MARKRLPEKLFRIGEIMEHCGLSRQTVNFYATIGLIREQTRTTAGYRLFPPSVFAEIERVKSLQKKGYTLRQIREMLDVRHAPRPDAAQTLQTEVFERGPSE
jgi:MerR family mercuric resistance operon transcriptional regulator